MWVAGDLNSLGNVALTRRPAGSAGATYTRALAIRERLAPNSLAVALASTTWVVASKSRRS